MIMHGTLVSNVISSRLVSFQVIYHSDSVSLGRAGIYSNAGAGAGMNLISTKGWDHT